MNKLITLKDKITGETIYPTTSSNAVIDENGNNICGIVTHTSELFNDIFISGVNEIISKSQAIKSLKGLDTNTEQKQLSYCIVDNNTVEKRLEILKDTVDDVNNKLQTTDYIDSYMEDIYDDCGLKSEVDTVIKDRVYIQYGTPQFAPAPDIKELMVDDNNIYIGINGVWYVINKSE